MCAWAVERHVTLKWALEIFPVSAIFYLREQTGRGQAVAVKEEGGHAGGSVGTPLVAAGRCWGRAPAVPKSLSS